MNSVFATFIFSMCNNESQDAWVMHNKDKEQTWSKFNKIADRIVIYGVGMMFDYFVNYYYEDIKVAYAVDTNCQRKYKKNTIDIYPVEKLYSDKKNTVVLVTFFSEADKVAKELHSNGFQNVFFLPTLEKKRLLVKKDMLKYKISKSFRRNVMIEIRQRDLLRSKELDRMNKHIEAVSKRVTDRYMELLHLYRIVNVLIDKTDDDELKIEQIKGIFTKRHFNTYVPNIANPKTFNEKIQYNNIFVKNPLFTRVSDKLQFKEFVKERVGEQYVVPLLGVWDSPEKIDFEQLPNAFVLKATSGGDSNRVIIVPDKNNLDIKGTVERMDTWMSYYASDYFYAFNWSFKEIPQRIIAEKMLPIVPDICYDYKVHCFHGEPKYIHVVNQYPHEVTVFDLEWNRVPLRDNYPEINFNIEKPSRFDEIVKLSRVLSREFDYVRVDFYVLPNEIYVGELTLTSFGGIVPFEKYEYDLNWGNLL